MGLLDRLSSVRDEYETKEKAAEARRKRNISVALAKEQARQNRIDRATPTSRAERIASARRQIEEAKRARASSRELKREAAKYQPKDEQTIVSRVARGLAGATKTVLEYEADRHDANGEDVKAMAARAEDAASAGPAIDATLSPAPGGTVEALTRGTYQGESDDDGFWYGFVTGGGVGAEGLEGEGDGEDFWYRFITGSGGGGPEERDEDPYSLDFDDPLGLTGGV